MNQAAGHFLLSASRSSSKAPCWNCSACFTLFIMLFFQIPAFPQALDDLLKNADDYFEKEQFHTAAQYYQVAVALQPEDARTNYRLAQSYRANFDYFMAANYYQKAMELDEVSYPLSQFYLAQMQKSLGNFKNARDGFDRFIKTNNKSSLIPDPEKTALLNQAKIEMEGSVWAIEQLGKSWIDIGFKIMPEPVNSHYNDYAAVAADDVLSITSGRKGVRGSLVDNRFGDYFTDNFRYKNQGDDWVQENSSDHFDRTNTKFSDGVGTYNSAGDKYYFTSCHEGNAYCKLYVIFKENGSWRKPTLLNENVNAPGFDNKHPTLTAGGDTLIFVSNRPGGSGGNDLWFTVSTNAEEWQPPQPLPGNINTPFNEVSPFCYGDNLLFFSSDGHPGIGSMDIFMAKDFTSASSEIQNLGTPFNSGYDDSFFSVVPGRGYLSSNRPGGAGKFDIYTFNFPDPNQDLAEYLEESATGSRLRSRIRDNDASNLYATRDEDQFYYDNLSAEERARLERILSARKSESNQSGLSTLSPDDAKYYQKLDIATKATIERLALRRASQLEGLADDSHMTTQEKLDWEYYQSIDASEKAIIDRILNARVEGSRETLARLSSEEKEYTTDPSNKERIETKVQLKSLNSLAQSLNEKHQQGVAKYQQNQRDLNGEKLDDDSFQYQLSRAGEYRESVAQLGPSQLLFYENLSPESRDGVHQSALIALIESHPDLNEATKTTLLSQFQLSGSGTILQAADEKSNSQTFTEIREALKANLSATFEASGLPFEVQLKKELSAQQLMLEQQLDRISRKEADTRQLQQQLQEFIDEQHEAPDPEMEARIVDEFYRQLFTLPLLTPKDSYYFNALSPGHQLRIARLASLVEKQTQEISLTAETGGYLPHQQATDQWYYLELSEPQRQIVDELVATGWEPEQTYQPHQLAFIRDLTPLERDRVERMMGKPQMNLEYQSDSRMAIQNFTSPVKETISEVPSELGQILDQNESVPVIQKLAATQIYFDFAKHSLRSEAAKALDELKQAIAESATPVKVIIEGHTDNIGSESYNQGLGMKRGISAADFIRSGTEIVDISTKSYGEELPAHDNGSATGRQLNRRVEVRIEGIEYRSSLQTYLVKPGVTLAMIADITGLGENQIMAWNGLKSKQLKPYQPVRLPAALDQQLLDSVLILPDKNNSGEKERIHTVISGDNMFRLAQRYQTTVQTLEELNHISSSDLLPGQQIRIR